MMAEEVWNHCANSCHTSWIVFLAALALCRAMLAMILTKLWAPQVGLLTPEHPAQCFIHSRMLVVCLLAWLIPEMRLINGLGMLLDQGEVYSSHPQFYCPQFQLTHARSTMVLLEARDPPPDSYQRVSSPMLHHRAYVFHLPPSYHRGILPSYINTRRVSAVQ